jgi:hypothetical protein
VRGEREREREREPVGCVHSERRSIAMRRASNEEVAITTAAMGLALPRCRLWVASLPNHNELRTT